MCQVYEEGVMTFYFCCVLQIDLRFRSIDDQPYQIDLGLVGIYVAKV